MVQGIVCVAGASLLFGIMPSANKFVMLSGMSAQCLTFYIQVMICLASLVIARIKRYSVCVTRPQLVHLLLLGAVGMGITTFLVNTAVMLIPVGLATVLHFLYPTIVAVAMVVIFGQRMSRYKLMAIACSICGMLLITNLKGGGEIQWGGILLALTSSLTYSFYMISNEKGEINSLPLIVKLIYSSMGSGVLFGVISAGGGSVSAPAGIPAFLMLLVCGLGSLGAYYLITAGIQRIGASVASFVNMLEPVTSVVVSAVAYQERPSLIMLLGMILILTSVFLVAMDGRAAPAKQEKIKHA